MILVIGSGVAGLSAALAAVRAGADVVLVTAGDLGGGAGALDTEPRVLGNTALAQGGIAAAIGATDRASDHLADTLLAGAGLSDRVAAEILVGDGARLVRDLLAAGFAADRDASGGVALGLEAAHSRDRIVHAGGDRTGAVLHAHLVDRVRAAASGDPARAHGGTLEVRERLVVERLLTDSGAAAGALMRDERGRCFDLRADAVVLATGGYASLYPMSSNHPDARGAGIVLAARAGAVVADLEFVQFHPTVLVEAGGVSAAELLRPTGQGLLISEAVRGAGAVLRDVGGERFMVGRHPGAELAPRDIVSLEAHRAMQRGDAAAVWLDATPIERVEGRGALRRRFPAISRSLAARGLDWTRDPVPVAPAAHYTMGGVATDTSGRSSVPALFVAGEAASTGVHGANRLASNSLLEGLVFGARAGAAAAGHRARSNEWIGARTAMARLVRESVRCDVEVGVGPGGDNRVGRDARPPAGDREVARSIGAHLGIERTADGLANAASVFGRSTSQAAHLATVICIAATTRTESRGAHVRSDFPASDPSFARRLGYRVSFAEGGSSLQPVAGPVDGPATVAFVPREYPLPIFDRETEQRSASAC